MPPAVGNGVQSTSPPEPDETPFGEDITNPDSRTMPPQFHGEWVWKLADCGVIGNKDRKVIGSDRIDVGGEVHAVIAVRFIDTGQVAVVTLPIDTETKQYSLYYFGLSEDGNSLIDLESTDWVLQRCASKAG